MENMDFILCATICVICVHVCIHEFVCVCACADTCLCRAQSINMFVVAMYIM